MTPERWRQIEEIFHEASDLDGVKRDEFVRNASGEDDELRAEVEKLLAQFEDASSFIEQPLYNSTKMGVLSALLDDGNDDPMVGKVLGSYRIEREIGRGGMGAVYEAVRADGEFRLRAALKVVKRGIDTDFVLRRFRNERQILAALDHPFITRLIDGGSTDDGRPYFVMEYIDGHPLYNYCDRNRLSIADRLQLFCRVAEAVEYAHQKLVIHRDLKPSNIFITNDGSPRLLDFGIAKLLDPAMASDTLQPTATALRMMTVDYASPEQIRGEKVTYATDVYSLGVILFELLTGIRPYKLESRSPHDVARAICDNDPGLASEALNGNFSLPAVPDNKVATSLFAIADLRRESPVELREQLQGSLDNIVLKALQKMPDQRYPTVGALRADIGKYLDGESVSLPEFYVSRSIPIDVQPSAEAKLVAVLPLSHMNPTGTESTDETYLTIGLADAIITRLTSVNKLTVRPTSSITRYNEHLINPFRAGRELGVDFVLDGRIRRFGERLRISLQLLDVNMGSAIWAGQFDEHLTDVLELEDAISEQVAAALIPQLTGEDKLKLAKRGTNNPQAYEAYLRGRFYWNQFTLVGFGKAIEAFKQAVELDPNYALAYTGIADFYIWGNIYGLVTCAEYYENALSALRRAISLDAQLGEAYASLALVTNNAFRPAEAERLLLKAIDLSPNYSLAHEWYSALMVSTGRIKQGIKAIRLAEELDPLSLRTKTLVAWTLYQAHDLEGALAKAEEIIRLDESYAQGHMQRGYILCELGQAEEAIPEIERGMSLMPGSALIQYYMCFALAKAGRINDARKLADEMEAAAQTGYVKVMFIGLARVATGEFDKAFHHFSEAVDERDPWLIWLTTEPKLEVIRSDRRYAQLVARMKAVEDRTDQGDDWFTPATSVLFNDSTTIPLADVQTGSVPPGFTRRHRTMIAVAAAAFVVILGFAGYWTGIAGLSIRGSASPENKIAGRSIAVLPFVNVTGDDGNTYISDGMSESLISRLSTFPEIRAIPRSAFERYKTAAVDPRAIGRDLAVDSVLVGTLSKESENYLLRLELIDVADGTKLLSMSFSERPERIFALQDTMSTKVMEAFRLQPTGSAVGRKSYSLNNEAFDQYLKGEYHRQKATSEDIRRSIEFYNKALELDPNYAVAFQGLALAYRTAPAYGTYSPQDSYPMAKEAAMKALSIDPQLGSAHIPLASIKFVYDWDFAGAEAEYKMAIQLVPSNAEAHYSYGNFLVAMGRYDEAIKELRIAQQFDPLSLTISSNIAWALYVAGRFDEAEILAKQVISRDPNFARGYLVLGEIYQEQGRSDDSIINFQKSQQISNDTINEMALGHVYATAGRTAEAMKIATGLEKKGMKKEVSPFLPAVVYAGLGDKDKAFYWLERAYQERSNWLTLIKVGRRMKNLRSDPRFDDLLKRIGFPT